MRKTKDSSLSNTEKILVNTENLQALLDCGRKSAVDTGTKAKASVRIGRRIFWNVQKVREYVNTLN